MEERPRPHTLAPGHASSGGGASGASHLLWGWALVSITSVISGFDLFFPAAPHSSWEAKV